MESRTFGSPDLAPAEAAVLAEFQNRASSLDEPHIREIPAILDMIRGGLQHESWISATGRRSEAGIALPTDGRRRILAEGWHGSGAALWIETGRSWTNYGFLQHVVEAAMVPELRAAVVAVRERYKGQPTFSNCAGFLVDVFASGRLVLPYETVLLIGY